MSKSQVKAETKEIRPDNGGGQKLAIFQEPRLPFHPAIEQRFGVTVGEWRALTDAVYPMAETADSVCLVLSYCEARKLDPFKRPVHIVPMWHEKLKRMVETVWPGISELRTTAFRTGLYAGKDDAVWGPDIELNLNGVKILVPEWCQYTLYRLAGVDARPFVGPKVYWEETYAQKAKNNRAPNSMWTKRKHGQLDKCAEAAALRATFPEEVGNDFAAEEMEGQVLVGDGGAEVFVPDDRPLRQHYVEAEYKKVATSAEERRQRRAASADIVDAEGTSAGAPAPGDDAAIAEETASEPETDNSDESDPTEEEVEAAADAYFVTPINGKGTLGGNFDNADDFATTLFEWLDPMVPGDQALLIGKNVDMIKRATENVSDATIRATLISMLSDV